MLSNTDTHILNNMQKHALRNLDYFGCNNEQNTILLYSSKDLFSCKKYAKGSSYLCFKRQIALFSGPNPCTNFHLNNTLAVELSRTVILLKTHLDFVYVECANNVTKIRIKSIFSKISLPTTCILTGSDFKVGSYPKNTIEHLDPVGVQIFHLDVQIWPKIEPNWFKMGPKG